MTHHRSQTLRLLTTLLSVVMAVLLGGTGCTKKSAAPDGKSGASGTGPTVFNFSRDSDPKTLDPQAQFDGASSEVTESLYDTPLTYHYLERPYRLIPLALAELPKDVTPDGKTVELTLRKGMFFVDDECFPGGKGREVVADDLIYTLKRFADFHVNQASYFLLAGHVVGLDEYRKETEKLPRDKVDHSKLNIAGVKKLDEYRISIELTAPNPLVFYAFTANSMGIVPREAVEKYKEEFAWHPVGSGPFKLKSYDKKQTLVLVKNPRYHERYPDQGMPGDKESGMLNDAGKPLPLVDEVRLEFIAEAQPNMLRFQKAELDWVGIDQSYFNQMIERSKDGAFKLKDDFAKKYQFYTEPGANTSYLGFNMDDPVVGKSVKLRQAFAHAIDVQAMLTLLANGRGHPLASVVPESIEGGELQTGAKPVPYDLERAKTLLKEAGYPEGKGLPELTMDIGGTSTASNNSFEFYRDALSKVGIKLKPNMVTFATFLKNLDSGNFQIASMAWTADYPDAENFYQLFYSKNVGGSNNTRFKHAEYDKLYEQIRAMKPSPERTALFVKMNEILRNEAPGIPLYNGTIAGLLQPWTKNFKRNVMVNRPFKYFNIDQVTRQKAAL